MPRITINTADDERVRDYHELPRRRALRGQEHFVVEGRWLVQRLLNSDVEVVSVLCSERQADEVFVCDARVPTYVAEQAVIDQLVGFEFHRGVLACGRRPHARKLEEVIENSQAPVLIAACAGVCDQQNLGSVIRNCRAFGVDALLLDGSCADPYSRRVMRVSAGAALTLPMVEFQDLYHDLHRLRREWGFELMATVLNDRAVPLERSPVPKRCVILFGNEGFGLDDRMTQLCDHHVTLPMRGGVDSLNVGVASGIFLHYFSLRQTSLLARDTPATG